MSRSSCSGLPKFAVGELVRLASRGGYPPEGFQDTGGFDACIMEIPEGSLGVVVHPPATSYSLPKEQRDIMTWVLVNGHLLEIPHPHIKRLR